jgi:hypothetical protein
MSFLAKVFDLIDVPVRLIIGPAPIEASWR